MNFGIWELVLIAVIVGMLFGFSKLGSIGPELGKAIKGFKNAMRDEDQTQPDGTKITDAERGSGDEKKS
jgi:sec-independent protein translocase protein TatA